MIFGKNKQQRLAVNQAACYELLNGKRKFAWKPIQLEDERWVWLGHYYAYAMCSRDTDGWTLHAVGRLRNYDDRSDYHVQLYQTPEHAGGE